MNLFNLKKSGFDILMIIVLVLAIAAALYYAVAGDNIPFVDKFFGTEKQAQVQPTSQQTPGKTVSDKTMKEVVEKAESRIDPRAIEEYTLEEARRKIDEARETEEAPQAEMPLTDIAPPPPVVNVSADEHPRERLKRMDLDMPPQYKRDVKLPPNTDIENPPRWNETIASPKIPAEAPDPFTAPPIKVDPRRVQE